MTPIQANAEIATVAALLKHGGRFLLCLRAPNRKWHPNVWELPGGHVEPGETTSAALVREIREELGVTVTPTGSGRKIVVPYTTVHYWSVREWTGSVTNRAPSEHLELRWVDPAELSELDLGPLASHLLTQNDAGGLP